MKAKPLARIVRIERQVSAARFENAEEPDHHLGRALDAQPHHGLGADAEALQMMRQPVGVSVERGVGQRAVLEHHRDRVRRALSLRGKQRRQGCGRNRLRRVVPTAQDGVALGSPQNRQAAERLCRIRNRGLQQPDETAADHLDGRFIEQIAGVLQHAVNAARRAVGKPALDQPDRQIELRTGGRNRLRRDCKPGQFQRRSPGLTRFERQHHLEQRVPRQGPRRIEHLDQSLERQLLVAVSRKVPAPHPADQLAEARLARRVGAQHQRVDEESDQIVQRRVSATRDRTADRDVGAGAEPAQQSGEARLQHHEQA